MVKGLAFLKPCPFAIINTLLFFLMRLQATGHAPLLNSSSVTGKATVRLLLFVGLLCGLTHTGVAQFCSGVLGGAVVNQTFGSNGPYRLQVGQTTYTNVGRCPNDGEYLITGSSTCYDGTWHTLPEDHTPNDVSGNMLIVNAAQDAGEFYNQPVRGLCYGTTYEFSIWVVNMMNTLPTNGCNAIAPVPLNSDVTMRVESANGQVLRTINTGSVPRTNTPAWIRYATIFTLPPGQNSVVIKLINNGPGGCGNDLALDDIQLRPCRPPLQIRFQNDVASTLALCEGDTAVVRSALGASYPAPAYQWQASQDSLSWHTVADAGGTVYTLRASATGKTYYRLLGAPVSQGAAPWDTACSTVSNTLTVTTLTGRDCGFPQLYVPDTFTPNTDGANDVFRAYYDDAANSGLQQFEMTVYNRWGSVIFVSHELERPWDGSYTAQPCEAGVYTWVIRYQFARSHQVKSFRRQGHILLVR